MVVSRGCMAFGRFVGIAVESCWRMKRFNGWVLLPEQLHDLRMRWCPLSNPRGWVGIGSRFNCVLNSATGFSCRFQLQIPLDSMYTRMSDMAQRYRCISASFLIPTLCRTRSPLQRMAEAIIRECKNRAASDVTPYIP
jgi:hypothetical protein